MRRLLLTCEHGGNRIPAAMQPYFRDRQGLLDSHRGWDPGAAAVTKALAKALRDRLVAPPIVQTHSRLLIDCNRSPQHRALYAPHLKSLPVSVRQKLLSGLFTRIYRQHRAAIFTTIRQHLDACSPPTPILHLAIHTFTPVLRGVRRQVDLGLLYDPQRPLEARCAHVLQGHLHRALAPLKVRRNTPYPGRADGLPTALRRLLAPTDYIGLEIELNQRHLRTAIWSRLVGALTQAFRQLHPTP